MINPNTPVINAGTKYVNGLSINQLNTLVLGVDPGAARDSLNLNDIISPTNLTINMDRVGINGLDSGSLIANKYYAVFVIGDSTKNNPTASIISLSSGNPILPVGYDIFRRIGWAATSPSVNNVRLSQYGDGTYRRYISDDPLQTLITNGTATSFGTGIINMGLFNFPAIETELLFNVTYTPALPGNLLEFGILGGSQPAVRFGCGVAATQVGVLTVPTIIINSVVFTRYRVAAGDTVTIVLNGFTDPLL